MTYDIFEGTEQIQQLVVSRAISGCTFADFGSGEAPRREAGTAAASRVAPTVSRATIVMHAPQ